MNWRSSARKDVRDAIRSRTIGLLLVVLVGVFVVGHVAFASSSGSFDEFLENVYTDLTWLVPIVALVVGYKAVLHERTSGTIVLALSLPQSRLDFVLGKLIGRSLVIVIPMVVGLLAAGVVGMGRYESISVLAFLAFIAVSVLYTVAFVAIALACSMSTTAGRRVLLGSIGAYVVLDQLWVVLVNEFAVALYRYDLSVANDLPEWAVFAQLLSPSEAYRHLVSSLFEFSTSRAHLAADAPWFVNSWTALLVLGLWIGVPIALGYRRFGRVDL